MSNCWILHRVSDISGDTGPAKELVHADIVAMESLASMKGFDQCLSAEWLLA